MTEKDKEMDLNGLHAEIEKSRKEIAALTASLNRMSASVDGDASGIVHRLAEVGAGGTAVAHNVAEEIRRHPVISSVAALGVGFVIAMLLFKRN